MGSLSSPEMFSYLIRHPIFIKYPIRILEGLTVNADIHLFHVLELAPNTWRVKSHT